MNGRSGAGMCQVQQPAARPGWQDTLSALPDGWLVAVTVIGVVALAVTAWLLAKRMDNKLTASVVHEYGAGTLPDLTEHHRASSMTVVADVLRAAADMAKAIRRTSGGGGDDSSTPDS